MNIQYELCPNCDNEVELEWDIETLGYQTTCPICNEMLMLCTACNETNIDCDWHNIYTNTNGAIHGWCCKNKE